MPEARELDLVQPPILATTYSVGRFVVIKCLWQSSPVTQKDPQKRLIRKGLSRGYGNSNFVLSPKEVIHFAIHLRRGGFSAVV